MTTIAPEKSKIDTIAAGATSEQEIPQKQYFYDGIRVESMLASIVKIDEQATSANGTVYTRTICVQRNTNNYLIVTFFNSKDSNVSDVVSQKLNLTPGSVVNLRNINIKYTSFARKDGTLGCSGQVRINSNGNLDVVSIYRAAA